MFSLWEHAPMTKLRTYLLSSGKKQSALASEIGVSKGYLSYLARGLKSPGLDTAFAIERATEGAVPASSWVFTQDEGAA